MYINKTRIYSKEVGEFKKLERIWKCDPRASAHFHIRDFALNIDKYYDRFEQKPSLEIRKIILAKSIQEANDTIYRWISEQSGHS